MGLVGLTDDMRGLGWLAAAALGFAPFNFPRARVFLGDVGSSFIGAWLAAMVAMELRSGLPPEAALAPVALSLADAAWTLAWRVRRSEQWSQPHCSHAYQRLAKLGWWHTRNTGVVGALIVACSALGAVSITASLSARAAADASLAAVLADYLATPDLLSERLHDGAGL